MIFLCYFSFEKYNSLLVEQVILFYDIFIVRREKKLIDLRRKT